MERPQAGVSSCLLGAEVQFNGGHRRFRFLTDELDPYVDRVPYCPEIEIEIGTPREPIRLTSEHRLVNRDRGSHGFDDGPAPARRGRWVPTLETCGLIAGWPSRPR